MIVQADLLRALPGLPPATARTPWPPIRTKYPAEVRMGEKLAEGPDCTFFARPTGLLCGEIKFPHQLGAHPASPRRRKSPCERQLSYLFW